MNIGISNCTRDKAPENVKKEVIDGSKSVSKAYNETREIVKEKDQEKHIITPAPKKFNETNDNIGWAKFSWNPVTGCKHGCEYCYAKEIAMRFDGNFEPKLHEDRLTAPSNTKPKLDVEGGNRVFVCSMADLFGTWVPNSWIDMVMEQVRNNPQWIFLFLTKNPRRYESIEWPDNAWVGATVDTQARVEPTEKAMERVVASVRFVSCEPLLESVKFNKPELFDWFLIGAKSEGARKIQPDTKWTQSIASQAFMAGKAVWYKDNMELPQEIPQL